MENKPRRDIISEQIEAAKAKGYEVIIIGSGDFKHHIEAAEMAGTEMAFLLERLSKLKNHVVIIEDVNKILSEEQQKKNMEVFQRPPIEFKLHFPEPLPFIETRKKPYQEKHFAGFSKRRKK